MHFLKVAALALFPLVLSAPSRRQSTSGTIVLPADGTVIAPGESFAFQYDSMADYGISSYNYTVWLLTSTPKSFGPSTNFAEGHYFGIFAEPNYPGKLPYLFSDIGTNRGDPRISSEKGNPSPTNPPPATLTMPDFSKNPGGFGSGKTDSNGNFALVVMEEYATGEGSVGFRLALAMNHIVYNGTTS
ncbi:hypothetical protein B0H12DRAFT_1108685 [Mycena haematopus]|nr:hypothetical protein B0H12DRAFT_1108685 [Mycena haematopus]